MDDDRPVLGRYANWFNIGHNNFEFMLDFGQFNAEEEREIVHTRIISGPVYAKVLATLLNESIRRHEEEFGEIPHA